MEGRRGLWARPIVERTLGPILLHGAREEPRGFAHERLQPNWTFERVGSPDGTADEEEYGSEAERVQATDAVAASLGQMRWQGVG